MFVGYLLHCSLADLYIYIYYYITVINFLPLTTVPSHIYIYPLEFLNLANSLCWLLHLLLTKNDTIFMDPPSSWPGLAPQVLKRQRAHMEAAKVLSFTEAGKREIHGDAGYVTVI
jgi:hypothetical protein